MCMGVGPGRTYIGLGQMLNDRAFSDGELFVAVGGRRGQPASFGSRRSPRGPWQRSWRREQSAEIGAASVAGLGGISAVVKIPCCCCVDGGPPSFKQYLQGFSDEFVN